MMRAKKLGLFLTIPLLIMMPFFVSTPASGAVTITLGDLVFANSPTAITVKGLTSGNSYILSVSSDHSQEASMEKKIFTADAGTEQPIMTFLDDTDNVFTLKVQVFNGTIPVAGEAGDATVYVSFTRETTFLPTGQLLNILIPVVVILLFLAIVIRIRQGTSG